MCCVDDGQKRLLIISTMLGVIAYDTQKDKIEWSVDGVLPRMQNRMYTCGVTTDGCGHLFVCDKFSQCIQMFSLDGQYLGVLGTEQKMYFPIKIRWSNKKSSLIVVCDEYEEDAFGKKSSVSVVEVEYCKPASQGLKL